MCRAPPHSHSHLTPTLPRARAGYSGNTGFEQADTALFYFVQDEADATYFVLVYDKPRKGASGGRAQMRIDAPELAGTGVQLVLKDDNANRACSFNAAGRPGNDCYEWDPATGSGSFGWKWASCCTDGMVLGPLPQDGWCFNLQLPYLENIFHAAVGSFNADTNDLDVVHLDFDTVTEHGLNVCSFQCDAYCGTHETCGACASDSACSWCPGSGCQLAGSTCAAGGAVEDGCCPACSAYASADACAEDPGCGWCFDSGMCMSTTTQGTSCSGDCTWFEADVTHVLNGRYCPGAVDGTFSTVDPLTSAVSAWCNDHGVCKHTPVGDAVVTSCECRHGFAGPSCEYTCPGFDATTGTLCSGHGTCDGVTGQCLCECGYAGKQCQVATGCVDAVEGDDALFCTIHSGTVKAPGLCGSKCGRKLSTGAYTGRYDVSTVDGVTIQCHCEPGWFGDDCRSACPGINATDGSGSACGDGGTCGGDGSCTCDACHSLGGGGVCVADACPSCDHGSCECHAATNTNVCKCAGHWHGAACDTCLCNNQDAGARCNEITGQCICPVTPGVQYTGGLCIDLPPATGAVTVVPQPPLSSDATSDAATSSDKLRADKVDMVSGERVVVEVSFKMPYGSFPDSLRARVLGSEGMRVRRLRVKSLGSKITQAAATGLPDTNWYSSPVVSGILSVGALLRGSDGVGDNPDYLTFEVELECSAGDADQATGTADLVLEMGSFASTVVLARASDFVDVDRVRPRLKTEVMGTTPSVDNMVRECGCGCGLWSVGVGVVCRLWSVGVAVAVAVCLALLRLWLTLPRWCGVLDTDPAWAACLHRSEADCRHRYQHVPRLLLRHPPPAHAGRCHPHQRQHHIDACRHLRQRLRHHRHPRRPQRGHPLPLHRHRSPGVRRGPACGLRGRRQWQCRSAGDVPPVPGC